MEDYRIHETAVVDQGAVIGAGTSVWHFSHIMPGARIGEKCNIGQNVFIDNNVTIGNGVKIQNNVSVYNSVVVEDDVFLGPSMVFTNVTNPRSFIERKSEFQATYIRKGASIGANATIVCGIEIGAYSLIGAGAVIIRDVPAYALVVGNPGKQVGWVSRTGIRLSFDANGMADCLSENTRYSLHNGLVKMAGNPV